MKILFPPLILCLASINAFASDEDDAIPEIVVTADFRATPEFQTASSLSIMTEEIIKSRSAQHFEELINAIPNMNYASGSNRARFYQIRGIGERSQFVAPLNSSVGFLIDGVDFSGAASAATLMDVQQVEVLRGPQGTRYGANALAGLVNVKTHDPAPDFAASLKLAAAEYGTQTLGGMVTGPLGDRTQARLVAEKHKSDGYYSNDYLNTDTNNDRDELTLRGKFLFQPDDQTEVSLTLARVAIDNGYDSFSLDNTRSTLSDEPGHDRQNSRSVAVEATWEKDRFNLVTLFNLANSDIEYGYDEDWSFTGIHPFGYTSTDDYRRDRQTRSAEIRLISNESSRLLAGSTDWVVGLYTLRSQEDLVRQYTFLAADFTSQYEFDTTAVFIQLDTSISDNLVLATGFRFERRDTHYANSDSAGFSPEDNQWGGKISLNYFPSAHLMTYASIARGYKAGGFNTEGSLDFDLREFDEEYLIEYELGLKARIPGTLDVRAAVFYDARHDQQVKSSLVRPRADGSTAFIDFIGNAAEGTNKGMEIEATWYSTPFLNFNMSVGLLEAKFDRYINEFGEDLSGRDQAQAPAFMYHLTAAFERHGWFAQFSVDGKDSYFFSDRHAVKSTRFALLNARVGYTSGKWKLSLWARNINDKDYFIRAFGSFGNDPRKDYVTEPYFQFGEPRIAGATLEISL